MPVKATGARVDFSRYELISDDNDDETLNPGEYATMKVYVQNTGSSGALTVYASLSTTDAYATIHTGNPVYVDSVMDPGEEQDANWSFEITSSTPDDHVIEFELLLLDEHDNLWTDSFSVPVRPTGADVIYSRHEIISDSDDDRVPEAGESVTMKVYLENTGSSSALTVNTSLSTTDAYTTIHTGNPVYVDSVMDPGEEQDANWSLELGEFMPSGHEIVFFLTSTDEHGNTWSDDFVLTEGVGAVGLVYYDHEVTEVSGDGDPRVEPGETWALDLALRNLGDSASDVASARLSTTDAHVVIGDDNSSAFGAIGPGDIEWSGDDYQFTVLASHPGGAIPFAIAISAGTLSFSGDFDVEVAP